MALRSRLLPPCPITLALTAVLAAAAPARAQAPAAPLELPAAAVPAAPWATAHVAARRPGLPRPTLPRLVLAASSAEAALATTGHGLQQPIREAFAFDPRRGVVGPLRLPPRTTWVGLGHGGRVLAATSEGALHEAAGLAAAVAGRFAARGQVPGARHWDAAGATVIAGAAKVAHVSRDGGRTFRRHPFAHELAQVFARSDGVVVARTMYDWPFVSRDGGATFAQPPRPADPEWERRRKPRTCPRSLFDSERSETWGTCWSSMLGPHFERLGDWIGATASLGGGGCSGTDRCHQYFSCVQGALAVDGVTWVAPVGPAAPPPGDWIAPFELGRTLRGAALPAWPRAAPAVGASAVAVSRECEADPAAWFKRTHGGGGGVGMGGLGWGRGCTGLRCLRPPVADEQPAHALFADARCAPGGCERGVVRPPTALAVDPAGRLALGPLPCAPARFLTRAGVALVACRADAAPHAAFLGDAGARWHPAGQLAALPDALQAAADGTLLLTSGCSDAGPCRAFVRPPAALAAAAPFVELPAPGVRAWRPAPGGRALAVARAPRPRGGALTVDVRGIESTPVVRGRYFDPFSASYSRPHPLEPLVARCLEPRRGAAAAAPAAGVIKITVSLDATGVLARVAVEGAPDAAAGRCIEAAVRALKLRRPPGTPGPLVASRWVGFTAPESSFALALHEPGRPALPLIAEVRFEGGLRDVRLDGRRILVDLELDRGERPHALHRDGTLTPSGPAAPVRGWRRR